MDIRSKDKWMARQTNADDVHAHVAFASFFP